MQAYEEALERRLGSDPGVVVLRNVKSRLFLPLDETPTDSQLARRWGERIAASVYRRIAETGPGDADLVRFEDQADYVAQFLADLVEGNASGRWYYGGFRYLDGRGVTEAATRVLLDNRDHLSAILVRLARRGVLGRAIAVMDAPALRSVWFSGLRRQPAPITGAGGDALEVFRRLVVSGRLQWPDSVNEAFLRELDLALSEMPWLDAEGVKTALIRHLPAEGSIQALHSGSQAEADGEANEDSASLDDALKVFRRLVAGGRLQWPASVDAAFLYDLDQALREMPWLDAEGIKSVIVRHLAAEGLIQAPRDESRPAAVGQEKKERPQSDDAPEVFRHLVARGRLRWPDTVNAAFLQELDQALSEMQLLDAEVIKSAIIRHLEAEGSNQALRDDSRAAANASASKDRALFDQACRLIDELGLWVDSPGSRDALFAGYRPQAIPDWRDAHALTQAVGDLLRFLAESGELRTFGGSVPADFLPRMEVAMGGYDWLDTLRLRTLLLELLTPRGQRPQRPKSSTTPRQRALLAELSAVLEGLEKRSPKPDRAEGWALRLYAALVDRFPHWTGDTLALRLIEGLAYVQDALGRLPAPPRVLTALRSGATEQALAALPEGTPTGAREGLRLLGTLGPKALALLEISGSAPHGKSYAVETRCAGALLLLRAIADLRLPMLTEGMAYPPDGSAARPGSWLIPLISRLAGVGEVRGEIDPGLAAILDFNRPSDWEGLRATWGLAKGQDHRRFQDALLRVLAGQRLLNADRLHVYAFLSQGNRLTLVGGDELGHLWPLGCVMEDWSRAPPTVEQWVQLRSDALGRLPAEVVVDATTAASAGFPADLGGGAKLVLVDEPGLDEGFHDAGPQNEGALYEGEGQADSREHAYREGKQALTAALRELGSARLGIPAADLGLDLLAIAVLRAWARWLPRFTQASVPYLLENFIRRDGTLYLDTSSLVVEMEPAPLDVVIEMAGYTTELGKLDWLGGRNLKFRIRR